MISVQNQTIADKPWVLLVIPFNFPSSKKQPLLLVHILKKIFLLHLNTIIHTHLKCTILAEVLWLSLFS